MIMNVKNFIHELDMLNEIVNATLDRDYATIAEFTMTGYDVMMRDDDNQFHFILRATGDGCAIYPQGCKYNDQYISFGDDSITLDEIVKLIENFFYEAE